MVNVKILSPAAFQSKVCGSAGEMAAGTDHVQDVGSVPQQRGDNQNPQNQSSESRSFQKMSESPFACLEYSACKHLDAGNTHPYLIGGRKGLLNGNSVTSATQDSPLSTIKLQSLSFGLSPIFVKYLQSITKPNSQQMCVYTTLWHGHSWQEGKRTNGYWHQTSHSPQKADPGISHTDEVTWAQRGCYLLNTPKGKMRTVKSVWFRSQCSTLLLVSMPQRSSFSRICKNVPRVYDSRIGIGKLFL